MKKAIEKLRVLSPRFEHEEKMDVRRRVSDVFPADAPDEGTRKHKKKTSSRASAVYISISVKAENAKKRNPKRATPTADEIRAGYMQSLYHKRQIQRH